MSWEQVEAKLPDAKALVFDGCHKIYLSMDDEQTERFRSYGYGADDGSELVLIADVASPIDRLNRWWDRSCGLRFISAVVSEGWGNDSFTPLIEQFELDVDEEEDDTDEDDL